MMENLVSASTAQKIPRKVRDAFMYILIDDI